MSSFVFFCVFTVSQYHHLNNILYMGSFVLYMGCLNAAIKHFFTKKFLYEGVFLPGNWEPLWAPVAFTSGRKITYSLEVSIFLTCSLREDSFPDTGGVGCGWVLEGVQAWE